MSNYFNRVIRVLTSDGLLITNHRVAFAVKKTSKRTNNSCQLRIYNLSDSTVSKFEKNKTVVTINAGYSEGLGAGVIFSGDVAEITTERDGADIVTVLELSTGSTIIRDKTVSIAMGGVVTAESALLKVTDSIGLRVNISDPIKQKYQSGFACYGAPMDAIHKICRKIGYLYSIDDGVLNVWKSGGSKKISVVKLSPSTGLVGRPEKIKDGWSVKSLLNATAVNGGIVRVESKTVTGNLKIESVTHNGDTHGDEWRTTVEGKIG